MSKKKETLRAGDPGSYVSIQFASGRVITNGVGAVNEDGFLTLEDGAEINPAHVECFRLAERPAVVEDENENAE